MADVYVLASPSPTLYAYPSGVHVGGSGLFGTVSLLHFPPLDPTPEHRQPRVARPALPHVARAIPATAVPAPPTNDDRARRRRDEEALLTLGAI